MRTTLNELRPGQSASVVKVGGRGDGHRRMVEMGLVSGATVEVVRVAPLGDPIEVSLKGYQLSLRKREAAEVVVETEEAG